MAASAARSIALFSSVSLGLGRASSRLALSSSSSGLLPRTALAFRGRSSFAATAVVMGKAGTADAEADAGMDAVQRRLMFEDE
jgi:isopentenyl-diphosphate delta-isomerase